MKVRVIAADNMKDYQSPDFSISNHQGHNRVIIIIDSIIKTIIFLINVLNIIIIPNMMMMMRI